MKNGKMWSLPSCNLNTGKRCAVKQQDDSFKDMCTTLNEISREGAQPASWGVKEAFSEEVAFELRLEERMNLSGIQAGRTLPGRACVKAGHQTRAWSVREL